MTHLDLLPQSISSQRPRDRGLPSELYEEGLFAGLSAKDILKKRKTSLSDCNQNKLGRPGKEGRLTKLTDGDIVEIDPASSKAVIISLLEGGTLPCLLRLTCRAAIFLLTPSLCKRWGAIMQLDQSAQRRYRGSGMGLAEVKDLYVMTSSEMGGFAKAGY